MEKIFKYPLKIGTNIINMPRFTMPLSIEIQDDIPVLYAMIRETDNYKEEEILVIMTGKEYDLSKYEFLGTAMLHKGSFVLHAFIKVIKD